MELNGWTSPQTLARYRACARSARARRTYDRIMDDTPQSPRCPAGGPAGQRLVHAGAGPGSGSGIGPGVGR